MNIVVSLDMLKPSTLAAIVADVYDQAEPDIKLIFTALNMLEDNVGREESIVYLVDAGVDAELARLLFDN